MFVEVARFENPIEAELACAALVSAGIEARLFDAGVSGIYGGALNLAPARLMVPSAEGEAARALLASADS